MMGDILLLNLSLSCLLRDKYKSALSLIRRVRDMNEMLLSLSNRVRDDRRNVLSLNSKVRDDNKKELSLSKWVRDNEGVGREGRSVGGVEVDDVGDGLLADGTEGGGGVGAHAAVFRAAPDALALVAAAFEEAYALDRTASGAESAAVAAGTRLIGAAARLDGGT